VPWAHELETFRHLDRGNRSERALARAHFPWDLGSALLGGRHADGDATHERERDDVFHLLHLKHGLSG
jgi:hypothetical protein